MFFFLLLLQKILIMFSRSPSFSLSHPHQCVITAENRTHSTDLPIPFPLLSLFRLFCHIWKFSFSIQLFNTVSGVVSGAWTNYSQRSPPPTPIRNNNYSLSLISIKMLISFSENVKWANRSHWVGAARRRRPAATSTPCRRFLAPLDVPFHSRRSARLFQTLGDQVS